MTEYSSACDSSATESKTGQTEGNITNTCPFCPSSKLSSRETHIALSADRSHDAGLHGLSHAPAPPAELHYQMLDQPCIDVDVTSRCTRGIEHIIIFNDLDVPDKLIFVIDFTTCQDPVANIIDKCIGLDRMLHSERDGWLDQQRSLLLSVLGLYHLHTEYIDTAALRTGGQQQCHGESSDDRLVMSVG